MLLCFLTICEMSMSKPVYVVGLVGYYGNGRHIIANNPEKFFPTIKEKLIAMNCNLVSQHQKTTEDYNRVGALVTEYEDLLAKNQEYGFPFREGGEDIYTKKQRLNRNLSVIEERMEKIAAMTTFSSCKVIDVATFGVGGTQIKKQKNEAVYNEAKDEFARGNIPIIVNGGGIFNELGLFEPVFLIVSQDILDICQERVPKAVVCLDAERKCYEECLRIETEKANYKSSDSSCSSHSGGKARVSAAAKRKAKKSSSSQLREESSQKIPMEAEKLYQMIRPTVSKNIEETIKLMDEIPVIVFSFENNEFLFDVGSSKKPFIQDYYFRNFKHLMRFLFDHFDENPDLEKKILEILIKLHIIKKVEQPILSPAMSLFQMPPPDPEDEQMVDDDSDEPYPILLDEKFEHDHENYRLEWTDNIDTHLNIFMNTIDGWSFVQKYSHLWI